MSWTMNTLLTTLTCCSFLVLCAADLEYTKYCERMCMYGRGGNLCRCNAVHFAGKRTPMVNLGDQPLGDDQDVMTAVREDAEQESLSDGWRRHEQQQQNSKTAKIISYLMSIIKQKHQQRPHLPQILQERHHQLLSKMRSIADRPSYKAKSLGDLLRERDYLQDKEGDYLQDRADSLSQALDTEAMQQD